MNTKLPANLVSVLRTTPLCASLVLGIAVSGCTSNRGNVYVKTASSESVKLLTPSASVESDKLVVRGGVRRVANYLPNPVGHVHVDVKSPDGKLLGDQCAYWNPQMTDDRPGRAMQDSRYDARFDFVPPPGADVLVTVVTGSSHDRHCQR